MKRFLRPTVLIIAMLVANIGHAFFDEIVELQKELQVWETTHAADFTDIIAQLEDITGPVFRDIEDTDWFNPFVSSLAEWGIVSGFKDESGRPTGEYRPGNNVTVAEVLKMALEAAEVDEKKCTNSPAHAQAGDHWAKMYVACAEQIGIRLLSPSIETDLNRPAARAEMLTIVHDAFGDQVLPLFSNFSDSKGHNYEADIAFANLYGIVNGDTNAEGVELGTFRPDDSINRAETAKIIYERLKIAVSQEETT